ncbi:hypothetical protein [Corynebacterium sp. HMSC29G08]|uniref:hypothetical protein n=1 Tax=Corynebacterium sp. HMSC29G08 TaxID=1581069 RepID=UPI0008D13E47|nr:hypothetical protein [Corynebacterium sp. HMSC29G08]OFT81368.1 hypothetical protein HMPREF3101_10475 [Corynebacterium sp. HMSC29G08]
MSPLAPGNIRRNLIASAGVARSQRTAPRDTDRPMVIAVAALSEQLLTTATTAVVATVLAAVVRPPVLAVDADGYNQPLRAALGSGVGGNILGLAQLPARDLKRTVIERYADSFGATALLGMPVTNPGRIAPETLLSAVQRASHRWPVIVVDLPFTCGEELIAAGTALASQVLLVTDRYHSGHSWLYQPGHHLSEAARQGRVTVAKVGARPDETDAEDTLTLPMSGVGHSARNRIIIPQDPVALVQYNQLLSRLYR